MADNFFAGADPIGQVIRIKKVPFTILETLVPNGQSPTGQDQVDVILMPATTAKKRVQGVTQANAGSVGSILVQAKGPEVMALAEQQIESLLRQRHHLQKTQEVDFNVRNLEEVFSAPESSARVVAILLAAIAPVFLMVGGIGIMNIMMAPVTERT